MLILVLLGMYFDAVVKFVTSQTLLFRLALAMLCIILYFFIFFKIQVVEMHKHFALLMTTTFGLGVMVIMENLAVEGQMVVKYP